jgi:hypothetical protein
VGVRSEDGELNCNEDCLCACCACCLAVREEHGLRVVERKIFGTKWEDVTGEGIKLYN